MKVALYIRVSTAEQNTQLQLSELKEYCQRREFEITGIYEDRASGKTNKRQQYQKLMLAALERRFDVVLVWKLDRWARSLKDLVNSLSELNELGIKFISLKDHLDLTTSAGTLMCHMLGAFAQFERDLIVSRVRAGLENAKRNGKKLGRPTTIDKDRVISLRHEGKSLLEIATILGTTKAGVSKTLHKHAPQLTGNIRLKIPQTGGK